MMPRASSAAYTAPHFGKKDLKEYLHFLEEAKKRDHRSGEQLISSAWSMSFPFFHPKGGLFQLLTDYMRKLLRKGGYQSEDTAHPLEDLYTSGH